MAASEYEVFIRDDWIARGLAIVVVRDMPGRYEVMVGFENGAPVMQVHEPDIELEGPSFRIPRELARPLGLALLREKETSADLLRVTLEREQSRVDKFIAYLVGTDGS